MANYCVYSGRGGTSVGTVAGSVPTTSEWNNAYISISECLAAITEAGGDNIFVANDHNYGYTANQTTLPQPTAASALTNIVSIDRSNTSTATPLAGATEYTNGNYSHQLGGRCYVWGLTLKAGAGGAAASANLTLGYANISMRSYFDNCTFVLDNTSATYIGVAGAGSGRQGLLALSNCTLTFGATTQYFLLTSTSYIHYDFINLIVSAGGSTPAALFKSSAQATITRSNGCDYTNATALVDVAHDDVQTHYHFFNCKIPSTITTGTHTGPGGPVVLCHACTTSDRIYDYYFQDGTGTIQQSTSIYLTTSPSQTKDQDGSLVSYSLSLATASQAGRAFPLYSPWVSVFVGSTGSKTISMKIAYDNATALKDVECWIEVEYYNNTGNPLSSIESSAPLVSGTITRDPLAAGSNLTDTSAGWTGTSGWSNKKTATLSKTVTVNQQGYVRARIALGKASVTIYADNTVTVA